MPGWMAAARHLGSRWPQMTRAPDRGVGGRSVERQGGLLFRTSFVMIVTDLESFSFLYRRHEILYDEKLKARGQLHLGRLHHGRWKI